MNTDRWDEIARVFDAVAVRAPHERAEAMTDLCGDDPELRREVECLLDESSEQSFILDRPVGEVAAELMIDPSLHLDPGTVVGPYLIVDLLGVGGMGEVYRARDAALNRDVAIKLLPAAFADDPERVARFKREAQVLASLNHPNIATIYGLETIAGRGAHPGSRTCIVMEVVDGPTLAERLQAPGVPSTQAVPLDEALRIARQIADALEAAHERGIVHRDLKPANIKVRDDGTVKVLDFGLAKIAGAPGGDDATTLQRRLSDSPTIPTPAHISPSFGGPAITAAGIILGTAAYMSPEQAKGKPADKRSDIWAFGCVIYEMLTGTRAFAGDEVSEVLASVLAREPDWSRLPSAVAPGLSTLLRRCFSKNPRQRLADVQDLRLALEGAFEVAALPVAQGRRSVWPPVGVAAGAAVVGGLIAAALLSSPGTRLNDLAPPRVSRLQLASTGAEAISVGGNSTHLTITPDGSRLAYLGNRGTQLFVRALDALEPLAVYTRLPQGPFASPDSRWIGFFDDAMLKKVSVSGGPAVSIATIDGAGAKGATWGSDGTIIFATPNGSTGLQRVSASGGPTTVLTRPDVEKGEADHVWPEWLPGGRAVLFTIAPTSGDVDASRIAVLDLQTGTSTVIVEGGSHGRFVPAAGGAAGPDGRAAGYLLYATTGTLWAVPLDLSALKTSGTPVAVVRDLATTSMGGLDAAVSADGTLAYASGGAAANIARTLVWVDRGGTETAIPAPPRAYAHPRLSPDGKHFAVFTADGELDIWVAEVARPPLRRITSGPGGKYFPVWTLNGHGLIFSSQRNSAGNLFRQSADGSGGSERLTTSPNRQSPTAISPDGQSLIFTETTARTVDDLMRLSLDGRLQVEALLQSPFSERNGVVSPDGRWLAYEANDSGRFEIYVRPYPDVSKSVRQVSTAGGAQPLWSRSGDELIYVGPAGGLFRVGVDRGESWDATTPTQVVKDGYYTSSRDPGRTFDISADGKRFLMIKKDAADSNGQPRNVIVVQHWVEDLKRLVPIK